MILSEYNSKGFDRGRSIFVEALWILVQALFVSSFIPGSAHRRVLLRWFGAAIGKRVIIKPGVKIKFPWRLSVGDYSWIGERVWIDNLDDVIIGANCCVSQGAYLCCGTHDWSKWSFDLECKPIIIQDHSWICAKCVVTSGVVVGEGAVLAMGSVASRNLESWKIYRGNPAQIVGQRELAKEVGDAEILTNVVHIS